MQYYVLNNSDRDKCPECFVAQLSMRSRPLLSITYDDMYLTPSDNHNHISGARHHLSATLTTSHAHAVLTVFLLLSHVQHWL